MSERSKLAFDAAADAAANVFEPYPPIAGLGVISDRRTAAIVAADGAVHWFCLPNYDGTPIFGSLVEAVRGGYWRLGPATGGRGRQVYLDGTNILVTRWQTPDGQLELSDAMLRPEDTRPEDEERARIIIRRLRCERGSIACAMELVARCDFRSGAAATTVRGGLRLDLAGYVLGLWTSGPVEQSGDRICTTLSLAAGQEFWAVLGLEVDPAGWSAERANAALQQAGGYWRQLSKRYHYQGPRRDSVIRSALAVELLSFAPTGALAAAATSSLPERIGGDRNYDYRYAWVRDASMAIATLSVLGDVESAERYLRWLARLGSSTGMPLQVLYRVDGGTNIEQHARDDLAGYRGSRPVRFGNHAYRQRQIDCFGYLADCAVIYLDQGGRWAPEYWQLIRRIADYTVKNWRKRSNGIWERDRQRHFVSSKVMSWTTLERALAFAERSGATANLRQWRRTLGDIHADVMARGWSERLQSFRQHYSADALDASTLLIPLMGFLPPDHPRVAATVRRIETDLMSDGLVYRFRTEPRGSSHDVPAGRAEGAFLPCCFWLAAVYAMMGRRDDAEALLRRVGDLTGDLGLLSEEADAQSGLLLGNIPMILSHAEYARAALQLAEAWPRGL
jgi:alpha,alpha-trehalase